MPKRPPTLLTCSFALLMLGAAFTSSSVWAAADGVRVFAEAMARMMDAMGLTGDGGGGPAPPAGAFPGFGPSFGAPFGMGQMPWSGMPGSDMPNWGAWMQQIPGMVQLPQGWRRTSLDGIWEGREGGLLIVQAHRFRLYSRHGDYIDGLIQQHGDRIALYDPEHDVARPYEFAEHQGRLVLRDATGQVYLYRRLWLDDMGYDNTGSSDPEQ